MEDWFYFPTALETFGDLESGPPSQSPRRRVPCKDAAAAAAELRRHHFLDACFLCGRTLVGNKDIFMYRGDTPFCSEECRERQIDADEASEKKKNRSKQQPAAARGEHEQRRQRQSPQVIPVWAR